MSICAYLMERNEVDSERDDYWKYEEYVSKDVFFEYYCTKDLLDVFRFHGYDGTDYNLVGTLELTDEQFEEFTETYEDNSGYDFNKYDVEILVKIEKYFEDGNWLLQLRLM